MEPTIFKPWLNLSRGSNSLNSVSVDLYVEIVKIIVFPMVDNYISIEF